MFFFFFQADDGIRDCSVTGVYMCALAVCVRDEVVAGFDAGPVALAVVEGGVDVLAHTFPASLDGSPWDRALPAMMKERGTALIPTLKLWPYELTRGGLPPDLIELVLGNGVAQTRAFAELGGQLLFGTDVGYMTDYH